MEALKICATVALAIVVVAVWSCCKMSGDCDRMEEKEKGKRIKNEKGAE